MDFKLECAWKCHNTGMETVQPTAVQPTAQDIARFRDNVKDEVDGAALYAALAAAAQIMANKEIALDTLVREELGIDPAELGGGGDLWCRRLARRLDFVKWFSTCSSNGRSV